MVRTPSSRTASARERRLQRRSATRRDFLLAARRFFSQEGIYDSRIEDITRHAGLAKGTLYLYFKSKEQLLKEVVQECFEEMEAFVLPRAEGLEKVDELAAALFRAHVEFFDDHPDVMRILHQVRGALKFDRVRWRGLRACLEDHLKAVAKSLARGEGRRLGQARRLELAVFLFGCASGACSVEVTVFPAHRLTRSVSQWTAWICANGRAPARAARGTKRR